MNGYFFDADSKLAFNTLLSMSKAQPERAVKLMMVGPSGYGKTTLPKVFAERAGLSFMRMNCATIRDSEEWFGYREAREGSTIFVRSAFSKLLEAGNVVIVLDEFNRLEPWLHNTLMPLLDDDGRTVVHDEVFTVGPGTIVVGTINVGYRFTGTFDLDEALLNRFDLTLEVKPLPIREEVTVLTERTGVSTVDAQMICIMAGILRDREVACSTRSTLTISRIVASGLSIRDAFEMAVIRRLPLDSQGTNLRKTVIDQVNEKLGTYKAGLHPHDIFGEVEEEVEVEVEVEMRGAVRIWHSKLPSPKYPLISVCRLLRSMSNLSLAEAKKIADGLANGQRMAMKVTSPPNVEELEFLELEWEAI